MGASGVEDFYRAAGALRAADKTVLRELTTSMRATAKPVVAAIRAEVRKSPSQGRQTAASVERQLHTLSKLKERRSGRLHDPATGQLSDELVAKEARRIQSHRRSIQRRLAKAGSLRENIAAATVASVSTKPGAVNLTFRVRSGGMPASQRKLPRRWNKANGWRHPVFGNPNVWVKQTGRPFFDTTIRARRDEVGAGVLSAMQAATEKIAKGEGGQL